MSKLPALLCDFYKLAHREQYPEGTELIYSTFTPRSNKYFPIANEVVVFGIQGFIKKYLINYFDEFFFEIPKEDVINEYRRFIKFAMNVENPDSTHIEELHDLGYLPIRIKALLEGTLAPIKVPVLTIENTNPRFFWLTNFLETIMSNSIWQPITSATIAYQYRKLLNDYAMKTVGNINGVEFQGHDFSMRGMSSLESAEYSGAGHLLSFVGTDTIPAILYHEYYYNANIEDELVGTSIPATEHSVMCSYGKTNELELFKHLINKVYPNGFFSVVSDTWDFWKVIGEYLPALKEDIMKRDGRVVIRPDSGDPVDIICGNYFPEYENLEDAEDDIIDKVREKAAKECGDGRTGYDEYLIPFIVNGVYYEICIEPFYNRHDKRYYYVDGLTTKYIKTYTPKIEDLGLIESLWNIFGGTITDKGYKLLDTHIGAIYGDSITLERAKEICRRLETKGFCSTNIVFGLGSYTYQYNTRDTFSFAIKATYAVVNGEERMLFKDPKTDDGTKKSQRGRVTVLRDPFTGVLEVKDGLNKKEADFYENADQLQTIFEDGELLIEQSLSEIRARLLGGN